MSRRGRKRKQGIKRFPNGQPARSRPEAREDMRQVVMEARQRVLGMSAAQAGMMPETTVLGALLARNEITQRQFDAAAAYREVEAMLAQTMEAPKLAAGDLQSMGGVDGRDGTDPAYVTRVKWVRQRAELCRRALNEASAEALAAKAAVNTVVLNDAALPHFLPEVRVGLNHLARALRLPLDEHRGVRNAAKEMQAEDASPDDSQPPGDLRL